MSSKKPSKKSTRKLEKKLEREPEKHEKKSSSKYVLTDLRFDEKTYFDTRTDAIAYLKRTRCAELKFKKEEERWFVDELECSLRLICNCGADDSDAAWNDKHSAKHDSSSSSSSDSSSSDEVSDTEEGVLCSHCGNMEALSVCKHTPEAGRICGFCKDPQRIGYRGKCILCLFEKGKDAHDEWDGLDELFDSVIGGLLEIGAAHATLGRKIRAPIVLKEKHKSVFKDVLQLFRFYEMGYNNKLMEMKLGKQTTEPKKPRKKQDKPKRRPVFRNKTPPSSMSDSSSSDSSSSESSSSESSSSESESE